MACAQSNIESFVSQKSVLSRSPSNQSKDHSVTNSSCTTMQPSSDIHHPEVSTSSFNVASDPAELLLEAACLPTHTDQDYRSFNHSSDSLSLDFEQPSRSRRVSTTSSIFSIDDPVVAINTLSDSDQDSEKRVASIDRQENLDSSRWLQCEFDAESICSEHVYASSESSFDSDSASVISLQKDEDNQYQADSPFLSAEHSFTSDASDDSEFETETSSIFKRFDKPITRSHSVDDEFVTDANTPSTRVEKRLSYPNGLSISTCDISSHPIFNEPMVKQVQEVESDQSDSSMDSEDTVYSMDSAEEATEMDKHSSCDCGSPSTLCGRYTFVDSLVRSTIESSPDLQDMIRILGYTLGDDILPESMLSKSSDPGSGKVTHGYHSSHRIGTLIRSITMAPHRRRHDHAKDNQAMNISSPYNFHNWKETVEKRGYGIDNVQYHDSTDSLVDSKDSFETAVNTSIDETPSDIQCKKEDVSDYQKPDIESAGTDDPTEADGEVMFPHLLLNRENERIVENVFRRISHCITPEESGENKSNDNKEDYSSDDNDKAFDPSSLLDMDQEICLPILGSVKRRSTMRGRNHSICQSHPTRSSTLIHSSTITGCQIQPLAALVE